MLGAPEPFGPKAVVRGKLRDRVHNPQRSNKEGSSSRDSNPGRPLTSLTPYRWAKPAHAFDLASALLITADTGINRMGVIGQTAN